ncbi:hypothetical protein PMAYCL1PPCAC_13230, partial [Pristionchus mayeri]
FSEERTREAREASPWLLAAPAASTTEEIKEEEERIRERNEGRRTKRAEQKRRKRDPRLLAGSPIPYAQQQKQPRQETHSRSSSNRQSTLLKVLRGRISKLRAA